MTFWPWATSVKLDAARAEPTRTITPRKAAIARNLELDFMNIIWLGVAHKTKLRFDQAAAGILHVEVVVDRVFLEGANHEWGE